MQTSLDVTHGMQCAVPSRVIIQEFFAVLVVKRATIRNVEIIVRHKAQLPLIAGVPKIQRKPNEVPVPAPRVLTALSHGFRLPMGDANSGYAPARAKIDYLRFRARPSTPLHPKQFQSAPHFRRERGTKRHHSQRDLFSSPLTQQFEQMSNALVVHRPPPD